MKSPAVIAHDEWPDLPPPSPCSACLTCLHAPALACSIPACPVCLAVGLSTLLSPTCCSSHLTCPSLPQSVPLALPTSPLAVSALDQSPSNFTPISDDNDFGDLFGRTTQRGNGKADLKGKGKAYPNNLQQKSKVCSSVYLSISC